MKTINRKIPGLLPPPPKTEIDGKITDLSSKSIPELIDLRERQLKLLNNKSFISKLSDKGEKIKTFHTRIVETLKAKQDEEQTCRLLHNLNLGNKSVQDLEWVGQMKPTKDIVLDSDDDSDPEDVLHILSQSTAQERTMKVLPPEKPLVTLEDIKSIEDMPHIMYIVDKTENNTCTTKTSHFKPYKTTKSDSHNPEKELSRKKGKYWEVTAASPPPSIHGPAKVLSIQESLNLQKAYNKHMKEIETRHAAEKLLARSGIKMLDLPIDVSSFGSYREVESDLELSDNEGSDKEVNDEEPEKGGVIFTVMK